MAGNSPPGTLCVTTRPGMDPGTTCLTRSPLTAPAGAHGGPARDRFSLGKLQLSAPDAISPEGAIKSLLQWNGFRVGPGLKPLFNGQPTTLEQIIRALHLAIPGIPLQDTDRLVRQQWAQLFRDAILNVRPLPPPPPYFVPPEDLPAPTGGALPVQTSAAWQGSWSLSSPGPGQHSVVVSATVGDPKDSPLQGVFQVAYNLTTRDVQGMIGLQLQSEPVGFDTDNWDNVQPAGSKDKLRSAAALWAQRVHVAVQASFFLQVMAGITNVGGSAANGALTLAMTGGGQLSVTMGPINITAQIGPTLQFQQGQGPSLLLTPAAQIGKDGAIPSNESMLPPVNGIGLIRIKLPTWFL